MKNFYISIFATALMSGSALAHTPPPPPAPAPAPIMTVATYSTSAFDWNGFYVGVGLTGSILSNGGPNFTTGYADLIIGANIVSDQLLFGLEGWIGGYSDSSPATGVGGGLSARVGYLVSPEALVYISGGGYFYDAGNNYGTLGAGVEFAVSNNVSLDLEYKYWSGINNNFTGSSIGASVNWGF